ncbi:kazal-type serine protease inhibitor domain-containing protein 1-like [Limanda limanda]|uniref:kazal-type serine protease inhibitor domain-containing protein 1-like n=1 Tax=Limanda limanda TaxID=27771 RepID=UPI0029C60A27|nr:kazal-type serine protease inhibitor domain-containing protein 1-like [Limanda limanda]
MKTRGLVLLGLCLTLSTCRASPTQLLEPGSRGEGPGGEGPWGEGPGGCGPCEPDLCPEPRGCRAGRVPGPCGCCPECGNLEGQDCDRGNRSVFYGLCGTGLRCQGGGAAGGGVGEDEQVCVCEHLDVVCGSDGRTYMNMCQFREEESSRPGLTTWGRGPCKTVPVIKVGPRSQVDGTGSSLVFLCEVFAFPMALVEWRKEGRDVVLPGDDPHVSVQSRGGPLKFELSSWLQIERAEPGDSGTYHCIARNHLGSVSASAVLGVLGAEELASYLANGVSERKQLMDASDYDQDSY